MEGPVHVWVGHCTKEFGVLLPNLSGRDGVEGYFGGRRRIGLEDSIFLPLLLIFLLDCYESVSFLGLQWFSVSNCAAVAVEGYLRLSTLWF